MLPGFFLDMAENTGNNFSHVILPGKSYSDIPLDTCHVTLVRSVVRSRDIDLVHIPSCVRNTDGFRFMNQTGNKLIGDTDLLSAPIVDSSPDPIDHLPKPTVLCASTFPPIQPRHPTLETFDPAVIPPVEEINILLAVTHSDLPDPAGNYSLTNDSPNIIS